MAEYLGALIYDSSINLAGLERDKNAAIAKLHSIGTEATKTFQNDIARALAKSVRPENFASDVAKAKALLGSIGTDTSKIFEKQLGKQAARQLLSPFVNELTTLKGQFQSSISEVFSIKNIAGGFLTASAITGAIRGIFEIGKATISIARDAVETRNKFDVLFGSLKDDVREFANVYAQEVGRSRIQTENFLSTIDGIFTTVGFAGREAAEFSKNITKLTFDLASFFNTTDDEALTALRSGLIGESEPLRRFNVFLSEARVAQEALAQGINKTSKELTEQDKIFLRYQIILKDTIAAQGDAVRTSDSLANQQKRLDANLENLGETIGETLVPALADATAGLNNFLENLTKTFTGKNADLISSFFGSIREDAKQMQIELDAIVKKSSNTTSLILPGSPLKFSANEINAIKSFLEYEKKSTLDVVTIEAERKKISERTLKELEEIVHLGGAQKDAAQEELRRREQIAQAIERTRKELEAIAVIKLPDYLTKSRQNFEFGKIRGADNKLLSDGQFKKELEVLLNIELTPALKLDTKKIIGVEKLTDDIRDALSDIGYPFKSFLIDLERTGVATEDELVGLADLFDRRLGDLTVSLFNFINKLSSGGTILGSVLSGVGLISTAGSLISNLLTGRNRQNDIERAQHFQEAEEARRLEEERLLDIGRQLTDQYEKLSDALLGFGVQSLQNQFLEIQDSIKNLIGTTRDLTEEQIRQILSVQSELKRVNEEISALLRSGEDVPQELLEKQKQLTDELAKLGGSLNDLTAEQILRLNELFKESGLVKNALDNFGKFANDFSGLINQLNFSFDVLNIDDPVQKLASLQKEIEKKFKAIIPTTEAGIRDLITQGVAALEAGGQTLIDFLKSRDLEELTAEQFRDLLQLLNNLANEAKSKVAGITDAANESVISQVRLATFEQTNALIDNTVTMRIVLTNILDAERQMLELARRNVGLTGSGTVVPSTRDRFFFFNDGVISETSAAALSQLQRKMYNDALAAAGGKGLS